MSVHTCKFAAVKIGTLLLVLTAAGQSRGAVMFNLVGQSPLNTAQVTFDYSASSNTNATITVGITNTSAVSGFLSGFAFNLPPSPASVTSIGGSTSGVESGPIGTGWYVLLDPGAINLPGGNDGLFDIGVKNSSGGNFINGGVGAVPGVTQGETQTFTLNVVGSGLNALTEMSFLDSQVSDPNKYFGIRAQGLPNSVNGGSDYLFATGDPMRITAVPEPSTLGSAGLAVLASVAFGWSRRKRAAA